jgi:hypothetical protein
MYPEMEHRLGTARHVHHETEGNQHYADNGPMWSDGVRSTRLSIESLLWLACILSFFFAAILLRPIALAFALIWLAVTGTVIPLHFYKAWRKLATVPNRREYAVWVLVETVFAAAAVAIFLYLAAGP